MCMISMSGLELFLLVLFFFLLLFKSLHVWRGAEERNAERPARTLPSDTASCVSGEGRLCSSLAYLASELRTTPPAVQTPSTNCMAC